MPAADITEQIEWKGIMDMYFKILKRDYSKTGYAERENMLHTEPKRDKWKK